MKNTVIVTQYVQASNRGREPERLAMKLAAIRRDPFAFFRGNAALFYDTLRADRSLLHSPTVLACGDLHLENFGSYKADNRLVYFDVSDFDESCAAPLALDLVRFAASILVAAKPLKIHEETATRLVTVFLENYAAQIQSAKPRWIERSIATGPVKDLLQSVKGHHRSDLIASRTVTKSGKTRFRIDGKKTLALPAQDRAHAEAILAACAAHQPSPGFFRPIDIARRIAGIGSLGLERYVALVQGTGKRDGQYLIDIKLAAPSALAPHAGVAQPRWKNDATRAASIQRITQAIPPALLGAVSVGKRSYLVRELQPSADRIDLATLHRKTAGKAGASVKIEEVVASMASITAWGHLRTCGRFGAATIDELVDYASRKPWRARVADSALKAAALALRQWEEYARDFDADLHLSVRPSR